MTWESGRNVTHFTCVAVKSPAVWGAIDLTSYYRGAEAGGGRQEHDTDNSWGSLALLSLFHCLTLFPYTSCCFLKLPLSLLSSFSLHFCLSSYFLLPFLYPTSKLRHLPLLHFLSLSPYLSLARWNLFHLWPFSLTAFFSIKSGNVTTIGWWSALFRTKFLVSI